MKKKDFLEKSVKIAFVFSFIIIISLFFLRVGLRGQKDVNYLENRTAYKIPTFSIYSFLDGTFQNNLELAVNDQVYGSEMLKKVDLHAENEIFEIIINPFHGDSYNLIANNAYGYGDSDYMVYLPYDNEFIASNISSLKNIADFYESIEIEDKYLYFINNDKSINFDNVNNEFYDEIITYYPSYKSSYLKINSFEDYKNYFYKTDHHWNYKGAYQGYKDIINLMFGEEEDFLKPVEEVVFKYATYGSKAKTKRYFNFKENFKAYKYNINNFITYIDGEKKEYGNKSKYFDNQNYKDKDYNLVYGDFYGWDYGEVLYDFDNKKRENLLIIGYSDTNAINELIASHFNKTYIVDFRHIGELNINNYIEEKKIDKLLYIANPSVFFSEDLIAEVK